MAEKETMGLPKRKQLRQPPAVPFLWEEKPGIPKRDWRHGVSSVSPILTPPLKLIASIPFDWEDKAGKPLNSFSQPSPPPQSELPTLPENFITFPSPSVCSQGYDVVNSKGVDSDNGEDDPKVLFEMDLEAFDFETDDSFSSAPSLLSNCLIPSVAISSAVPMQKSSSRDYDRSGELEIPSTPASETDSSTSSYATGFSGLVGASFLECLFPLLPPKPGFLERVGCSDMSRLTQPEMKTKDFDNESNTSVVIRRPTTLGELIMMSRRKSYQRKAHTYPTLHHAQKQIRWTIFKIYYEWHLSYRPLPPLQEI